MDTDWKAWFTTFSGFGSGEMAEVGFWGFLALMVVSLLCALFISFFYVKFYKSRATGSEVHRAFPLLGISVTAIFITIQFSLPLSLGLLGALSIVRFRTPIKEPEEIGFIMLVIATSICCATFNIVFLGIILLVAVGALVVSRAAQPLLKGRFNDGMLIITLPTSEYQGQNVKLTNLLEKKLPKGRIESITESRDESVISYSFRQMTKDTLRELPGEVRKIAGNAKSNVFFNRSGEV